MSEVLYLIDSIKRDRLASESLLRELAKLIVIQCPKANLEFEIGLMVREFQADLGFLGGSKISPKVAMAYALSRIEALETKYKGVEFDSIFASALNHAQLKAEEQVKPHSEEEAE